MVSNRMLVAVVAVLLTVTPVVADAAESSTLVAVGTFVPTTVNPNYNDLDGAWPYASDVDLHLDDKRRLLYAIDSQNPAFAATYSADALTPLGAGVHLGARAQVVEDDARGLLVATGGSDSRNATESIELVVPDAAGRLTVHSAPLPVDGLGGPTHLAVGMYPVPDSTLVYVLSVATSGFVPSIDGTVTLSQVDIDGIQDGTLTVNWTHPLPDCLVPARSIATDGVAVGWVPETNSVYFPCADVDAVVNGVYKAPAPSGVGRLVLTDTSDGGSLPDHYELYPLAGDFKQGDSHFDALTRRLVVTATTAAVGATAYVFDATTGSFVGGVAVGSSPPNGATLALETGRYYAMSPNIGLVAADIRSTPVSQGRSEKRYMTSPQNETSSIPPGPLLADPARNRVFIRPYVLGIEQEGHFTIVEDRAPRWAPPSASSPDVHTTDVEESPGRTGASFAGSVQGYGSRQRQVGGWRGLQFNVVPVSFNVEPVRGGTRELRGAHLNAVALTNQEASASAIAADRDESNTGGDQAATGTEWPYEAAHCADFSGEAAPDETDGATVECDLANRQVSAEATSMGSQAGGAETGPSSVHGAIVLDPDRGMVARVTASAEGLSFLDGLLTIGRVTATTEAVAHGRPGTAATSFERTLHDVSVAGQPLCTGPCDPEVVAAAVNSRFPGRLRLDFPEPDEQLAAGSPGGYLAISRRIEAEQVQAVQFDEQAADRLEVPGMVVTVYSDNTRPGRTIYEFAGTEAEARYGIFLLAQPGPDIPNEPQPGPEAPPAPGDVVRDDPFAPPGETAQLRVDVATSEEPPPAPPVAAPDDLIREVTERVRGLLVNGPDTALPVFAVWALLFVPVYLSARRRMMLARGGVVPA